MQKLLDVVEPGLIVAEKRVRQGREQQDKPERDQHRLHNVGATERGHTTSGRPVAFLASRSSPTSHRAAPYKVQRPPRGGSEAA